jgi:hypothetical protein
MERLLRRIYGREPAASGWPVRAIAAIAAIMIGIAAVVVLAASGVAAGGSHSHSAANAPGAGGWYPGGQPASRPASSPLPSSPAPSGTGSSGPAPSSPAPTDSAGLTGQFRGIILPDLLVVVPAGLTSAEIGNLGKISGVRDMITFDGAQITVAGQPASVIGVSPGQFRSWVPLRTASDQAVWTALADGGFIASDPAAVSLGLTAGASYPLSAATTLTVPFDGSAQLGIAGVDLLVSQAVSRKLGLVHQVAALLSAPGLTMPALRAQVALALGSGSGARVVALRGQRPPAITTTTPANITSYLQLFQASAAQYCPNLSWTVLAAIGQIESGDGRNVGPSTAGALGPMQFLPATWSAWGIDGFGQTGPPDVQNPLDAVPSAARMLCADGASAGTAAGLRQAIFDYNHAGWYVNEVLALAAQYAAGYR